MISPHAVAPRLLLRHEILNRGDEPVSPAEVRQLEALIQHHKSVCAAALQKYRASRDAEMIEVADAGGVSPIEPMEPLDEASIQKRVALLQEIARRKNQSVPTVDEIRANLTRLPRAPEGVSVLVHRGQVFRFDAFKELPRTDPLYVEVRYSGSNFLAEVAGWFVAQNLAAWSDVEPLVRRAAEYTSSQARGLPEPTVSNR